MTLNYIDLVPTA